MVRRGARIIMIIIPISTTKKIDDAIIEKIRNKLNSLLFVDAVYPAVKIGVRENGDSYPQLYAQLEKSKIIDLTPSSRWKGYMFFEKNGFKSHEEKNIYNFSLIFWGQLNAIDENKQEDYTSVLLAETLEILRNLNCYDMSIQEEDCFEKYNLHDSKKRMFMYPYTEFKINFSINGFVDC